MDEYRLRGVQPGVLQHVEGAHGVDVEVGERLLGRPVVAGLSGGVDHHRDAGAVLLEDLLQPVPVTDVDVEVGVGVTQLAGQAQQAPRGGAVLAEEVPAQVVVDAHHVQAQTGEVAGRLGADQAGGSGHQRDAHENSCGWAAGTRAAYPPGTV